MLFFRSIFKLYFRVSTVHARYTGTGGFSFINLEAVTLIQVFIYVGHADLSK